MIRNKNFLKSVALFLLVEIIFSTIAPTVSWALTAGPTSPEATSFEPVDTTDMVDLKTGDFTYNIPLLEVPGPAGSYPLSLSYHAGIMPDLESSWVGLGWSLNPGSITRLVNGYPDDHKGISQVNRAFWEGGETTSSTVGLSVGIANVATVSAGLTFAQDTYRGFGQGMYLSMGAGYQNFSANLSSGTSPYGGSYTSMGVGVGVSVGSNEALNSSLALGLNYDLAGGFNAGGSLGVGVGRISLLQASINTVTRGISTDIGGGSTSIHNGKSNKVSSSSNGFIIDIPVYYGLNIRLGRQYQRYWIDENEFAHTYGALHLNSAGPDNRIAFDTYDLLDLSLDVENHDDAEKVLGGSFPDTDYYTVMAQGLSGNIKPYHFRQYLFRQNKKDESDEFISKGFRLNNTSLDNPVEFRFINDFSNRLEYNPSNFKNSVDGLDYNFDGNIITGKDGSEGFVNNHLAGSKHVQWYTNSQILRSDQDRNPFQEGFIDCFADGFQRSNDTQLGGFSITNASGITYHYALPVYSYNEYSKSVNSSTKQSEEGISFNELNKPERYAYTWFLTAVVGPDYVDRNLNGLADKGDWGYWVNFEYKKHLSDYKWRNPGEGTNKDLDGNFESFSSGKKELYYLDKVITESHVALFEKSIRNDGREVIDVIRGGFDPRLMGDSQQETDCKNQCYDQLCPQGTCTSPLVQKCIEDCDQKYEDVVLGYNYPRGTLKLQSIKLFNYQDFIANNTGDEFLLRRIEFQHDYSLAQGTANSFDETTAQLSGKLTLNALLFSGKRGLSHIPPMKFFYKKNDPYGVDKRDIWGYYKSDFDPILNHSTNEIIGRMTTNISASNVDVWSLSEIETTLGATIKIEYESDQYEDVALSKFQFLRVKDVIDHEQNKFKITFWESNFSLSKYFHKGEEIDIDLIAAYQNNFYSSRECNCSFNGQYPIGFNVSLLSGSSIVDEIDPANGFIIISSEDYYKKVKTEAKVFTDLAPLNTDCEDDNVLVCKVTYGGAYAMPKYFVAGVVSLAEEKRFGGGVRVKSILIDALGDDRKTSYEYEGGVTSYEPYEILAPKINPAYLLVTNYSPVQSMRVYKRIMLGKVHKQLSISRQLPGPGVMYKSVVVKESNISSADGIPHELPNFTKYEFETVNEGMIDVNYWPAFDGNLTEIQKAVKIIKGSNNDYEGVQYDNKYFNGMSLKDFSSRIGSLKKVTLYHKKDNIVTPVSETVNEYLHDGLDGSFESNKTIYEGRLANEFTNQGVVEETFTRSRIQRFNKLDFKPYVLPGEKTLFNNEQRHLLATVSKVETFPTVLIGQSNYNYITGIKTSNKNKAFDFYSGEVTEILASDSYGNNYKSVSIPAYTKYADMGLKVNNKLNKQMLTQITGNYSFLVNSESKPIGVLAATVKTWSNNSIILGLNEKQVNVWRPKSVYVWNSKLPMNSDFSVVLKEFDASSFDWASSSMVGDNWEKIEDVTLYNVYSHALEAKDINGNAVATRMDPKQYKVISSAANATYYETANSGAEYLDGNAEMEGGVDRGAGSPSLAHTHTGKYSLMVGTGSLGFNYTLASTKTDLSKKYRASVWVYAPGESETQIELDKVQLFYTDNGQEKSISPKLQKSKSKNWYLLNIDVSPSLMGDVYIGVRNNAQRSVYFDDFRVHPIDAGFTTYIYDNFSGELTYILDNNNFYTRFEYDAMGRLLRTSKELLNYDFGKGKESFKADMVLQETKYNYKKNN